MLIALISLSWLAVTTLVVAACQVAARADLMLGDELRLREPFRFEAA
ncbi:MAG TPA: hypothetical protein VF380_03995 [Solirubrobacteraceae bacterium]